MQPRSVQTAEMPTALPPMAKEVTLMPDISWLMFVGAFFLVVGYALGRSDLGPRKEHFIDDTPNPPPVQYNRREEENPYGPYHYP